MAPRTPRMAPEERQAQLLDCARAELAYSGFGLITVEAIAQRAGVTRPVVYDLFGDLETLLLAVIARAAEANARSLDAVLNAPRADVAPGDFLVDAFRAFLQAVRADPDNWRLLLMPPRGNSPELRRRIRGARRVITNEIKQLVDWGAEVLGFTTVDNELLAKLIEAACEDAARLTLTQPDRFTPERLTESAADLVTLLAPGAARSEGRTAPEHRAIPAPAPLGEPSAEPAPTGKRIPRAQRREQLLDVALEMLVRDGVGSLSMEGIARRAGVNRVVLYRSFANLPALLTALMEREDRRARETLLGLLPRSPEGHAPDAVLFHAAAFLLESVSEHPLSWRLALARPESAPRELQPIVHARRAEWARRIEPLVTYVLHDLKPGAGAHEVEAIARMLLTVGEELGRLSLEDPAFTPERLLEGVWSILGAVHLPAGARR